MSSIDMNTFVKTLQSKVKNGLTYEMLEQMTGIPKSSIQRYVKKGNGPATRIDAIADALGISSDVFRSNNDYQNGPFGERLSRVMVERQIDAEELAELINLPVDLVEELTAEPDPPSDELLRKFALALFVDVPWLRGETNFPMFFVDNEEYRLVSEYRQSSSDTRRAIRAILDANPNRR